MMCLQLGISAKVSILVSRLHPKNLISKAYANYTKSDKAEGLVVVSKGPKSICQEEKVIIIFRHPPKGNLMEEFKCWAIHHFAHVMEKGNEEDVFMSSNDGGSNNSGGVGAAKPNPNITRNPTQHNPEDAQTNETVPTEVVQLFESNSSTLDSDEVNLVWQILPGMVDDDNQPLPENIPTPAKEGQDTDLLCDKAVSGSRTQVIPDPTRVLLQLTQIGLIYPQTRTQEMGMDYQTTMMRACYK